MSINFFTSGVQVSVTGAEGAALHLGRISNEAVHNLHKTITRIAIELTRHVKQDKLSGQVLGGNSKGNTGTLRRSINYKIDERPGQIGAVVGTPVVYAGVHEFGFHGVVTVKEHLRLQKMAWGRLMKEPKMVTVSTHSMKMNLPERSFLRSALSDMKDDAIAQLQAAVRKATEGGA